MSTIKDEEELYQNLKNLLIYRIVVFKLIQFCVALSSTINIVILLIGRGTSTSARG